MSPSMTSRGGGHGEHGILPGRKESGPRGRGEQPSVPVHAMRFRSIVIVLSARPYCTRPSMTREREASGEELMGVSYRPLVAKRGDGDRCVLLYLLLPRAITPYTKTPRCSFIGNRSSVSTQTVSISDDAHTSLKTVLPNYRGAIAHGTPLSDNDQCALHVLQGPGTGDRS
jgi:hypothetical protein